jgi:hypothetical protein
VSATLIDAKNGDAVLPEDPVQADEPKSEPVDVKPEAEDGDKPLVAANEAPVADEAKDDEHKKTSHDQYDEGSDKTKKGVKPQASSEVGLAKRPSPSFPNALKPSKPDDDHEQEHKREDYAEKRDDDKQKKEEEHKKKKEDEKKREEYEKKKEEEYKREKEEEYKKEKEDEKKKEEKKKKEKTKEKENEEEDDDRRHDEPAPDHLANAFITSDQDIVVGELSVSATITQKKPDHPAAEDKPKVEVAEDEKASEDKAAPEPHQTVADEPKEPVVAKILDAVKVNKEEEKEEASAADESQGEVGEEKKESEAEKVDEKPVPAEEDLQERGAPDGSDAPRAVPVPRPMPGALRADD